MERVNTDGQKSKRSSAKDRPYYASEVFLRESIRLASNNGWTEYKTWALRARVAMQRAAVTQIREVCFCIEEDKNTIALMDEFRQSLADGVDLTHGNVIANSVDEDSLAWQQIDDFADFLQRLAKAAPRLAEDIENALAANHREAMLSDFTTWCPGAPYVNRRSIYEHTTAGIALSGGGIRSASFCLGVIGALASQGALTNLHYVSGVSGGGYTASWLTAWAYRHKDGMSGVQAELSAGVANSAPVQWIRRYTSYLCPKPGLLATDTWALLVSYIRNWLPVLFLVLAMTTLGLMVPRLVVHAVTHSLEFPQLSLWLTTGSFVIIVLFLSLMRYLTLFKKQTRSRIPSYYLPITVAVGAGIVSMALVIVFPKINLFIGQAKENGRAPDYLFSYLFGSAPSRLLPWSWGAYGLATIFASLGPAVNRCRFAILRLLSIWFPTKFYDVAEPLYEPRMGLLYRLGAVLVGGAVATLTVVCFAPFFVNESVNHLSVIGPLVGVTTFGAAEVAIAVFLERQQDDIDRAWASRLGGWNLGAVAVWILLCILSLGSPWASEKLGSTVSIWLAVCLLCITFFITRLTSRLGSLIPAVIICMILLFSFAGLALEPLLSVVLKAFSSFQWAIAIIAAFTLLIVISTDVNRFSLHSIYREGLVRTFLGASRMNSRNTSIYRPLEKVREGEDRQFKPRRPDAATDIDSSDDPKLEWLDPGMERRYPLLLLNAAVNGSSATEAEGRFPRQWPFTFSSLFCGSPAFGIGYAPTASFFSRSRVGTALTLGTAMAVSGAAVSPASGKMTHPIRAFLLSILNARLGLWIGNPSHPKNVRHKDPFLHPVAIVKDLLGVRAKIAPWIHLSDGGHFENLGVYELVRRGCRFIIAIDASCDPQNFDAELGNAIRRVRIDLGVNILAQPQVASPETQKLANTNPVGNMRLDAGHDKLQPTFYASQGNEDSVANLSLPEFETNSRPEIFAEEGFTGSAQGGWTLFDINYGPGLALGKLLYIKPTVAPNDQSIPVDVRNYAQSSKRFPHETTADQIFSEAQMEAYRALGESSANTAFLACIRGNREFGNYFNSKLVAAQIAKPLQNMEAASDPSIG